MLARLGLVSIGRCCSFFASFLEEKLFALSARASMAADLDGSPG